MKKKLRVAICEDDKTQSEYVSLLVERWSEENETAWQTDTFSSAEQLLFSFDGDLPYDFYILDIQMGQMNGMELARKIREQDKVATILFLTGLKEYALEGYEVGAVRYLIKPIEEKQFFSVLNEVYLPKEQSDVYKTEGNVFLLEDAEGIRKISYMDIWYLEAQGHYVKLVFGTESVQWKATFGSLQEDFEKNGFVMTKRGMLVNLAKITRIGKNECVLDNGEILPVSRSQYKSVNEDFISYYRR